MTITPSQSESDTNLSPQRRAWAEKNLDPEAQTLLAEDEKYFLRQSVSTPCLNAIVKAEGVFIEDTAGRRMMDFHGNNVHHMVTAIRGSSAPSPSRWKPCHSRRGATPLSPPWRWRKNSPSSRLAT